MKSDELRALQAPIKDQYRANPAAGLVTLSSRGKLGEEQVTCKVETGRAVIEAGLHPATGGTGLAACSGNNAVATSLGIALRSGEVSAEGDLDFRGTLGVAKDAPQTLRSSPQTSLSRSSVTH